MESEKLIGKQAAVQELAAAFAAGKLPHALLLTGEDGIGKKTLARAVCRMLCCKEPTNGQPCGRCSACLKIDRQIHPDIFWIYPAGKSETIGVGEIKALLPRLYVLPNDADCKIFVLSGAERMNRFAQNALLKMLEEPPEDCFFILTAENAQALLPTVRSRVTQLQVPPASRQEIVAELARRFPSILEKQLETAAARSGGNLGKAVSLCEQPEKNRLYEDVEALLRALLSGDEAEVCLLMGPYCKQKQQALEMVALLEVFFRDLAAQASGASQLFSGDDAAISALSGKIRLAGALAAMQSCDRFISAVRSNANPALQLTVLALELEQAVQG